MNKINMFKNQYWILLITFILWQNNKLKKHSLTGCLKAVFFL